MGAAPAAGDGQGLWGPIERLAGTWEGEGGLDTAFAHHLGKVLETPYRERVSFTPFGPVQNGRQSLYGLDYRTSMWRRDEDLPFHTEVGYWLWDADTTEVMRCFVVPRGITAFASGLAASDADHVRLSATAGERRTGIGENLYLAENASTLSYAVELTIGDDSWSYAETTMLAMREFDEPFPHTDHNTLHRVA